MKLKPITAKQLYEKYKYSYYEGSNISGFICGYSLSSNYVLIALSEKNNYRSTTDNAYINPVYNDGPFGYVYIHSSYIKRYYKLNKS